MAGSGGRSPVDLTIDQRELQAAAKACKSMADGKELRKELMRNLKRATAPLVVDLKASISTASTGSSSPSITSAIAQSIKPAVRLSGENTGVSVRAGTINVRGFKQAARRFNRGSWRHPVYGGPGFAEQVGRPNWFDGITKARKDDAKRAVLAAMEQMSKTLANRSRGT